MNARRLGKMKRKRKHNLELFCGTRPLSDVRKIIATYLKSLFFLTPRLGSH